MNEINDLKKKLHIFEIKYKFTNISLRYSGIFVFRIFNKDALSSVKLTIEVVKLWQ